MEDLTIEAIKTMGMDVLYLPREYVKKDLLFGEDVLSQFEKTYEIEMYLQSVDGFQGEGDILAKYGLEVKDKVELVVARRRFMDEVGNLEPIPRPREGDLIYFPLSGSMFEIKFVEHENPFYQVGKLFVFKMQCELFEYSGEDFDTGSYADLIELDQAYSIGLTMTSTDAYSIGENITTNGVVVGEVQTSLGNATTIIHNTATLTVGDTLVGVDSGVSDTIAAINDVLTMSNDGSAQNKDFEDKADNYLDFSETNPFGEVT